MVVENHTPQARSIVSVSTDAAATAEMHQMTMVKTMMVMTRAARYPAKGKTSLSPNGLHVMLFGLKTRPSPGDKIDLTLKLDDGTTVPVEATVRK